MFSFKDYLLLEDVFGKGGELFAAVNINSTPRASTTTSINTNKHALGVQKSTTRGTPVYYAFAYKPSDVPGGSTDLLKSFKGKGPFKFPADRKLRFLDAACEHIASEFRKHRLAPDVIVTPQSSSGVAAEFANTLADKLKVPARKIGAFKKVEGIDLSGTPEENRKLVMSKFIDMDHFNEKFVGGEAAREKNLRELVQSIIRSIKKNGSIVAKEINKPMLKFVKNIVQSNLSADDSKSLSGKKVLVIDDVLSSGATMTDIFRAVRELNASDVYGCALFGRTSVTGADK